MIRLIKIKKINLSLSLLTSSLEFSAHFITGDADIFHYFAGNKKDLYKFLL